jgi:hypothetical protein
MRPPPEECPTCGESVPRNAKACPGCGSDWDTGWSDDAHSQNLGLPDEKFDYDEFVKNEFGEEKEAGKRLHWAWWLVVLGLIVLFALAFVT